MSVKKIDAGFDIFFEREDFGAWITGWLFCLGCPIVCKSNFQSVISHFGYKKSNLLIV